MKQLSKSIITRRVEWQAKVSHDSNARPDAMCICTPGGAYGKSIDEVGAQVGISMKEVEMNVSVASGKSGVA